MSTSKDDLLLGDIDDIGIRDGDAEEQFDYYLVGSDRGEFGFDADEIQDIRSMLKRTLGDG